MSAVQTEGIPNESTWYGELYAIHKLKVAAARYMLSAADIAMADAYTQALAECRALGLTDEILLERLKV